MRRQMREQRFENHAPHEIGALIRVLDPIDHVGMDDDDGRHPLGGEVLERTVGLGLPLDCDQDGRKLQELDDFLHRPAGDAIRPQEFVGRDVRLPLHLGADAADDPLDLAELVGQDTQEP